MGSGKHSTSWRDKRNSFDDYSEPNQYNTSNDEYTENINNNHNNDEENNFVEQPVNSYNNEYERKMDFTEANFWDEDESEINYKKIMIIAGIIIAIVVAGVLIYKFVINKPQSEEVLPTGQNEPVTMTSTIEGYSVLGKVIIPSLNIEQYILNSVDAKALQNGIGRIDNGASINNYGNFCLAGHNNQTIFANLDKLNQGDEIILVDRNMEESVYKVTEKFEVEPDNLECLLQNEEKIEVTLITCQDGATKRLIVKATLEEEV